MSISTQTEFWEGCSNFYDDPKYSDYNKNPKSVKEQASMNKISGDEFEEDNRQWLKRQLDILGHTELLVEKGDRLIKKPYGALCNNHLRIDGEWFDTDTIVGFINSDTNQLQPIAVLSAKLSTQERVTQPMYCSLHYKTEFPNLLCGVVTRDTKDSHKNGEDANMYTRACKRAKESGLPKLDGIYVLRDEDNVQGYRFGGMIRPMNELPRDIVDVYQEALGSQKEAETTPEIVW